MKLIAGIVIGIVSGAVPLLLLFFGQTALDVRSHLDAAADVSDLAVAMQAHLEDAERFEDFVKKGGRFTKKDGYELTLRVAKLETDATWANQRIDDTMDVVRAEIARLSTEVDRLVTHNGGPKR